MNFWIGVVSRAHVQVGVRGGFVQLNHGKKAPLQRLKAGDGIAMYSPRTHYPDGELVQAFTAIGTVTSGEVYQVEVAPDFKPYRVNVDFAPGSEAPIRPPLDRLLITQGKRHWGAAFRFGYVTVSGADFALIERAMRRANPATRS